MTSSCGALNRLTSAASSAIGLRTGGITMAFETYSTISYVGNNGGTPVSGQFVESETGLWVENNLFVFEEVSETDQFVELYDINRDLTVTFNLLTNKMDIVFGSNRIVWDVVGVKKSISPLDPIFGQVLSEGTAAKDTFKGDVEQQDIFLFDTRSQNSADTINKYGSNDILVTTTKLFDSNNDGIVSFGKNKILDFTGGTGSANIVDENGKAVRALEYDGVVEHDGVSYYVYSAVGSEAGTASLHFS